MGAACNSSCKDGCRDAETKGDTTTGCDEGVLKVNQVPAFGAGIEEDLQELEAQNDESPQCTLGAAAQGVGETICPVQAPAAESVREFEEMSMLAKLFEASGEDLGATFSVDSTAIAATQNGSSGGFACAVSDPTIRDCPLIYISSGFTDLTGFPTDFANGRSCRFLQPTNIALNDAVNLDDRKLMREFCAEVKPPGTTIINLLLNEHWNGKRFWNLLRMQHINVDGHAYILGVQTTLAAYMPNALAKRFVGTAKNGKIVCATSLFCEALKTMKTQIRDMLHLPFIQLKERVEFAMNVLKGVPVIMPPAVEAIPNPIVSAPGRLPKAGDLVEVVQDIKYPSFTFLAKSRGVVSSVTDTSVNINWNFNDGDVLKGVLKRDIQHLKII